MSILTEVKEHLAVPAAETYFDRQLIDTINFAFVALQDFGVTDVTDFIVVDNTTDWPVFTNTRIASAVKSYIPAKVRQTFDPTASASVKDAMDSHVVELESRVMIEVATTIEPIP